MSRRCFICGTDVREEHPDAPDEFRAMLRHVRGREDVQHRRVSFVGPVVVDREALPSS